MPQRCSPILEVPPRRHHRVQLLDRSRSTCANRSGYITSHTALPVACIPNAGLPINVDGQCALPAASSPDGNRACELRQRVRRERRRRMLRVNTRSTSASWCARVGGDIASAGDAGSRAAPRKQHARHRPPSAACARCSSASGSMRRGRARSSACSLPTTTTASSVSPGPRSRAVHTRSTCASRSPSAAMRRSRCAPSSRRCR